jgi:uncharacterized protein
VISYSTRDTLENTARTQVELNRRARRVFAQAAARAAELDGFEPPITSLEAGNSIRNRSGSAASHTTGTSDSGDGESLPSGHSYNSGISSTTSQHTYRSGASSSGSTGAFSASSPAPVFSYSSTSLLSPASNPASALSPIASRVLEQDASAMEAYIRRNRSGSGSTDVKTGESASPSPALPLGYTPVSSGPSMNGDDLASLPDMSKSVVPRRRLRPSFSAAQLRAYGKPSSIVTAVTPSQDATPRNRAGTNSGPTKPGSPRSPLADSFSPPPATSRAFPSRNSSLNALSMMMDETEPDKLVGPSSDYAVFPDPPEENLSPNATPTLSTSRRLPFNLLSRPLHSLDLHHGHGHRRGASIHSLR